MMALGGIPKLFDRNFAVGFFIPAGITLALLWLILDAFGRLPAWLRFESAAAFLDAAVIAVAAWLLAVFLVAINRTVVRTLEGYTFETVVTPQIRLFGRTIPPFQVFGFLERRWKRRFEREADKPLEHQHAVDRARAKGQEPPAGAPNHASDLRRAVERYPDQARHVLPTSFGNRYRAIEVYSRVVYGLDAIPAWPRIQALLPKEALERLAEAKAQLDFCVNVLLAGLVAIVTYGYLAIITVSLAAWWLPILGAVTAFLGYRTAGDALQQYGEHVKSAFDLHRADLAERLGLALPRAAEMEREMWTEVSRMMVYRSPAAWARLVRFRKRGGTEL